ncbi:hypothetical protein DICPUDRAFT_76441 [Dictyostelium purpureum]|uniref:Cytochrome P450 n=1 Tax=Dictyostelium purpureum TaxID=5786 RepID=F0ZDL7_DICPU|nr:uncharacterized protein DICPUDRAFT_76441 [Dictyostelium purpureum]EGC37962.1 hypothetical protein DICPUDRAFT_76441 [Dictyostelium purpureum]|eukprot:XP_003285533.1 hypothetical protein DICPUDRAFT_76441 [Dictyostelium purpureum]
MLSISTILLFVMILFLAYRGIEYLILRRSFSLVHPIKGVMNGIKPHFIIGDLPLQHLFNIKPKLKKLGDIYFRWFFWYPIVEIKDINSLQYVYNERSNNYSVYWNLAKSSNFLLTGSEIKRFFRVYYCSFSCTDSMNRIFPVIKDQVNDYLKSSLFQNSVLSTEKDIPNFMLKLLARVYLGSGDEAYSCLKANYKKFNRTYMDFIHYLFPKLLKIPTRFSKKYMKNKYKRSLYQVIAMKAYYGVVKQSDNDEREDSMINIIAETSYNDKEGLSLDEIKMPTYLLNGSSIKGPIIELQSIIFLLMENPEVESKIRKEIKTVLKKNGRTIENLTVDDIQEMVYLEATINEINRLYPPFPKLIPRQTKESDRILGYHIPKGTMISCPVADILRDPKIFDSPNEFKPERQLKFASNPKFASPSISSIQEINETRNKHKSCPIDKILPLNIDLNHPQNSKLSVSDPNVKIPTLHKRSTSIGEKTYQHSTRVDELKGDPLNISKPQPSFHLPFKPQPKSTYPSCSAFLDESRNNPIINNQYNSYSNLTTEERNERIVKNLPWGIGSRKCLGKELAKLITKTIIVVMYSQYTFERYTPPTHHYFNIYNDECPQPQKSKIEITMNPEIKPPLLFKSKKIVPTSLVLPNN